jgi:hypothetical protein
MIADDKIAAVHMSLFGPFASFRCFARATVVGQLALDRLFYRLVAKPCCPSIRQGPSNFDCVCALGAALP